jgi:hypothetical protein
MTNDLERLIEQLQLAKKIEKALKERTNQITAALQQSQTELEVAIAKRQVLETQLGEAQLGEAQLKP